MPLYLFYSGSYRDRHWQGHGYRRLTVTVKVTVTLWFNFQTWNLKINAEWSSYWRQTFTVIVTCASGLQWNRECFGSLRSDCRSPAPGRRLSVTVSLAVRARNSELGRTPPFCDWQPGHTRTAQAVLCVTSHLTVARRAPGRETWSHRHGDWYVLNVTTGMTKKFAL